MILAPCRDSQGTMRGGGRRNSCQGQREGTRLWEPATINSEMGQGPLRVPGKARQELKPQMVAENHYGQAGIILAP